MPRLPSVATYQATAPSASGGITTISADTKRPDLATGRAMQEIGLAMQQEAEKLDETLALEAVNQLQEKHIDLTYGDNGFTKLQGKAVTERPIIKEYHEQAKSFAEGLAAKISSPGAKQRFLGVAGRMNTDLQGKVAVHSAKQVDLMDEQAFIGAQAQAMSLAKNGDLAGAEAYFAPVLGAALGRKGLQGDAAALFSKEAMGAVYATGIEGYLAKGQTQAALDLFNTHKSAMTEAQVEKYDTRIKVKNDYVQGLEISAKVRSEGLTGTAALSRMQELAGPNKELAESARIDFEHKAALDKVARQETVGAAEEIFQKGGFTHKSMQAAEQSEAFQSLPKDEQTKLRKSMLRDVEHKISFGQSQQSSYDARRLENPERLAEYMSLLDNPAALMQYSDGQIMSMRDTHGMPAVTRLLAEKHKTRSAMDKYKIPTEDVEAALPPALRKPKTPLDTLRRDRFEVLVTEATKDWITDHPGMLPDAAGKKSILEQAGREVKAANRYLPGEDQYPAWQFKPAPTEFEAAVQAEAAKQGKRSATREEIDAMWRKRPESRIK